MKKKFLVSALCLLGIAVVFGIPEAAGEGEDADGASISVQRYLSLADVISKNSASMVDAANTAEAVASSVMAKGTDEESSFKLFSEAVSTIIAATVGMPDENIASAAGAVVSAVEKFAESKGYSPEYAMKLCKGFVATVCIVSENEFGEPDKKLLGIVTDSLPGEYAEAAAAATAAPLSVLGTRQAMVCRSIYNEIRKKFSGEEVEEGEEGEPFFVTVTTTTSTTTTTTTTTIPAIYTDNFPRKPVPQVIPTTRPSPTPVGRR